MVQTTSSITPNDIRARILRLPRPIREAIPRGQDTLDIRIAALDFYGALTIDRTHAYLGGVTELFRRVAILRDGDDGPQGRRSRVTWSYDPQANIASLELALEGDWQPLGAKAAEDSSATASDPAVLVAEGLATYTPEREEARRRAVADARAFVESHLGALTPDDVRHLLQLFNVDHRNGRPKADRFAPGFGGALANDIVASTNALNRWIPRLWEATTDAAIERVLDDFWAAKEVPGAGRSLPTMLLHVRDPEHHFPIMTGLAKGYAVLTGRSAAGRTGAMYLDYARGLVELRRSYDVPVHATDLVLMAAARRGAAGPDAPASEPEVVALGFSGFSDAAFQFLADLAVNNNDTWMKTRREAFGALVREPMRALVVELGTRFVQPYAPELEHEPKSPATLASIRKNAYGAVKEPYWPHYWCALHRKGVKKTQDFQLYVYIRGDELRYGFYTGSASALEVEALAAAIERYPELAARTISEIRANGLHVWVDDDGLSKEPVPSALESPSHLATHIRTTPLVIGRRVPRAEATARGAAVADDVVEAFRVLYPLFALATRSDPAEILSQHWQEAEVIIPDEPDIEDVYDRDTLMADTLLAESEIEELEQLLAEKPQLILYGAPGTGKTFLAEALARYLTRNGGEKRVVQFHPSYGYEDFVEGIRPVVSTGSDPNAGQVGYRVEPGIFRHLCDQARKRPKQTFVLVVDEINRGNLPRIFGELLYLLERRGPAYEVDLPISRQPFSVPTNLVVIGTMNTADQSIALVDIALRRRFHFFGLSPNPPRLREWLATHAPRMVDVANLLQKLNDALRDEGIDENLFIGHAHFMRKGLDELALQRVWKRSIEPTLEEYFYGKREKVARFRFEAFVEGELAAAPAVSEEAAGE